MLHTQKTTEKIILIGMDGATFDIILPLVREGKLPSFARLLEEGTWGNTTAIPPDSPEMWTSIITGVKPEKHGIHDFGYQNDDKFIPFNISFIKPMPLWRILSNRNKKVGIFDWLFAWPPEKVNGFMVTLDERSMSPFPMAYPKNLTLCYPLLSFEYFLTLNKINFTKRGHFIDNINCTSEEYIKLVTSIEKYKEELFLNLFRKNPEVDFFAYVSYLPDDLQHLYYSYMEPYYFDVEKEEVKKYGNVIPEAYELLDNFLENFIDDENITLIIVSDHGFHRRDITAGPLLVKNFSDFGRYNHIVFRMNYLLNKTGFLSFDERGEEIDFSKTKAYFCNNLTFSGICITSRNEYERNYTIEEVVKILKNIKLENGERIFLNINTTNSSNGPNILFQLNPLLLKKETFKFEFKGKGSHAYDTPASIKYIVINTTLIRKILLFNTSFEIDELIDFSQLSGGHQINGIIIMKGKNIKKNFTIQNVYPIDIAPTILYLLKEKIPTYMDGKVLTEAIKEEYLSKNPILYTKEKYISPTLTPKISKEGEFKTIEERLKELGYLK